MSNKHKSYKFERHHRKCVSNGIDNRESNISLVSKKSHIHWHALFQNMEPQEIASLINSVWISKDYTFVCIKKKE